MFLKSDNSLNLKKMLWGGGITVALCAAGVLWFDRPLYILLRELNFGGFIDAIFSAGNWLVVTLVITVISIVISLSKARRTKSWAPALAGVTKRLKTNPFAMMFLSVAAASVITGVLKVVLGRMRPIFFEALGQTGFYPFTADWAFNSMPSGHTAATFAGLVMVGLLYPKYKWATWTGAIIIGASRICHGAHWPTDVLLGAFIGMVAADVIKGKLTINNEQ